MLYTRIYVYSAEIIQKEVTKSKTHVLLQRRWPQTPKGATKKKQRTIHFYLSKRKFGLPSPFC